MNRSATPKSSSLAALFPSLAMARLVIFFLVHPGERFHVRELQRRTRLSSASLQKELGRLRQMGAVVREKDGARVVYRADEQHGSWGGWMRLISSGAEPADVLRESIVGVSEIRDALVFGSMAEGTAGPDSDVDVLLVGPRRATDAAVAALVEAEYLVGRPIDVVAFEPGELDRKLIDGNAFVRHVFDRPQISIGGLLEQSTPLETVS
jgi:predicted nucleotidyltransferase